MAVERYHITDKGEVDLCRSDPSNPRSTGCRFKDEFGVVLPHFDSVEDAQGYLDAQNASRQIPAAVSKPAVEAVAQEVVEPVAASATATATAVAEQPLDEAAAQAEEFVAGLTKVKPNSPEFEAMASVIAAIGDKDTQLVTSLQGGILDRTVGARLTGGEATIGRDMATLRTTIEDLDPTRQPKGVTGALSSLLPGKNKLKAYFKRFDSASDQLKSIITSLERGSDALQRDNIELKDERTKLWSAIQGLEKSADELSALDKAVEGRIAAMEADDPEAAATYRGEVLFSIRQKHQDVLTQIAVARQGYQALDIIRKNNVNLIGTVERTKNTTVGALQVAVLQQSALDTQGAVLKQAGAVQDMTSGMIERTSEQLRDQSGKITESLANPVVATESLKNSFKNLYAAIDESDVATGKANEALAANIATLRTLVNDTRLDSVQ